MAGLDRFETRALMRDDGAEIWLRVAPNSGRPRLLLSHGNGFAIGGYRVFWSLLADDFEIALFDLRNHGLNPLGELATHTVNAMARDHVAVRGALDKFFGARPTIGVFHSISSIAAVMAGRDHGAVWDALALIDPPLTAPEGHPLRAASGKLDAKLAELARARPHRFADVDELATQFSARMGRGWAPGAAADMAAAITRPAAGGGFELACPGAYEAQIYEDNARTPSFEALGAMRQPTFLIGADPQAERPMPPALVGPAAAQAHGLPHDVVPGTSHMLQIEKPAETAAILRARLRALGLG